MAILVALAILGATPNVHIGGAAEPVVQKVRARLPLEVPGIQLVAAAEDAALRFEVEGLDGQLWLREANTRRRLGMWSNPDAAVRVAVLVIARRVRAQTAAPRPPPAAPARTAPPALVSTPLPSLPLAPYRGHRWRVEAAGAMVVAPVASSHDLGATVAAQYRPLDRAFLGVRAMAVSMCCGATRVNDLQLSGWLIGGFAEGGVDYPFGPVTIAATLGIGLVQEMLWAQIVGVFSGPTTSEATAEVSVAARAGLRLSLWLGPHAEVFVRGGGFVRPDPTRVQLPAPYNQDRDPVGRRAASPFVESGLSMGF